MHQHNTYRGICKKNVTKEVHWPVASNDRAKSIAFYKYNNEWSLISALLSMKIKWKQIYTRSKSNQYNIHRQTVLYIKIEFNFFSVKMNCTHMCRTLVCWAQTDASYVYKIYRVKNVKSYQRSLHSESEVQQVKI